MAYEFKICELEERKALCGRETCAHDQIGPTIGRLYGKIGAVRAQLGLEMDGPPFCRYRAWRESDCEIEPGCWIKGDGPKEGEVYESTTPAGRAFTTTHVGPYDKLSEAHHACMAYASESGLQVNDACWEVYLTDPGREPDSSKWVTELYYPIA